MAAPTIPDYNVTTTENNSVSGAVVGEDADNDGLIYNPGVQPANGSLSSDSVGGWQYIPNPNFSGEDSFTIIVDDGNGGQATSTITVTVTPYAPTLDDVKTKIGANEQLNYKDVLAVYTEAKAKMTIIVEDVEYYGGKLSVDYSADDLSTASGVIKAIDDINKLAAHGQRLAYDLAKMNITTPQQTKLQELIVSLNL